MIDYAGMLLEFHLKYGHLVNEKPVSQVDTLTRLLRIRLIREEFFELIDAIYNENIVDIADSLADLLYVVFGTAVSFGMPIDEVFAEVHRSNMTKSAEKDGNGKTVKGPGWEPPELIDILMRSEHEK